MACPPYHRRAIRRTAEALSEAGYFMGYGRDERAWSAQQFDEIRLVVMRAYEADDEILFGISNGLSDDCPEPIIVEGAN